MIDPKELKIGNKVNYSDSFTPTEFDIITVASINDIDKIIRDNEDTLYTYCTLYPIPLTPEILEKCGLNGTKINFEKSIKVNVSLSNNVVYIGNATSTSGSVVKDIKYLHQLQNLYVALTGEELEIKELQEN